MQRITPLFMALIAFSLLAPRQAPAADRNKLIFVSDLHMNLDANYAWLKTNAAPLAAFLDRVNEREDVAELIILGDMLDDWIEPVENVPHTFHDILTDPINAGIVTSLQALCQNTNITVTYVTGNHDLLSFEPANKTVITNMFPGLHIISDSPGLGAYTKNNVIWAEHGHRYCMFNAPDTWSRTNGHLPMGYFISRIAATKSARDNKVYTTMDALDQMIKSPEDYGIPASEVGYGEADDFFIRALFNGFALLWGQLNPWTTAYTMNGTDLFTNNPTIDSIGGTFDRISSQWAYRMDIVAQSDAIMNEIGHLASSATLLFEMPDRIKSKYPFTPRIVIFGHTHQAALYCHFDSIVSIYANSGTWVDKKPCTWVEVEINRAGDKDFYTVSVWFDGEQTPRLQATLDTPAGGRRAQGIPYLPLLFDP